MSHQSQQKHDVRCTHTSADGRRCRMPLMKDHPSLCPAHWRREQELLEAERVGDEMLGANNHFKTANAVNDALGKLFALTAKKRIPVRDAAVLAYIGQLLLHSLPAVRQELVVSGGSQDLGDIIRCGIEIEARKAAGQLFRTGRDSTFPASNLPSNVQLVRRQPTSAAQSGVSPRKQNPSGLCPTQPEGSPG